MGFLESALQSYIIILYAYFDTSHENPQSYYLVAFPRSEGILQEHR